MENVAISIDNLSKKYDIGVERATSFRESLMTLFSQKRSTKEFWALSDITLDIPKGETIGIIGRNGAGKSTLLKVLSKITYPTRGKVTIYGRVASLLEVGTGFHAELSGRENIYLNGTILGMRRREVKCKFDEIVHFSGIEKFIDTPVKRYSSGMYVRLAFAVAAHLEPEILIIDEVLAVGDMEFQKKCMGKMDDVAKSGRTVLFVSHNMGAINRLCKKSILLENGQIAFSGSTKKGISLYTQSMKMDSAYFSENQDSNLDVSINQAEVLNEDNLATTSFETRNSIVIKFSLSIRNYKKGYSLFVMVKDDYGSPVFPAEISIEKNVEVYELKIAQNFLTRGFYYVHAFIHIPQVTQIDVVDNICSFSVVDTESNLTIHGDYNYGNVFGEYEWVTK